MRLAVSISIENKITTDAEGAISSLKTAINLLKENVENERNKIEESKWEHLKHTTIGALLGTNAAIGISTVLYIFMH